MGRKDKPNDDKTICAAAPGPAVFVCPVCGDCLSSQDYLDEHMLDSHAQRPQGKLECSCCPYTTNKRSNLTHHERTHTGARPFSCPSCNKNFTLKSTLVKHQRVHTGEKPYKCSTCGCQFRESSNLLRHEKLHLDGGKPSACRYCGKAFRLKGDLTRHLLTHTGERRHACRVCGQKFMQGGSARHHERKVHSVQIPSVESASLREGSENITPE